MQAQGLLTLQGQSFALTADGKRLALQVVRAHRLLERYFADEARLPLKQIHAAAADAKTYSENLKAAFPDLQQAGFVDLSASYLYAAPD